MQFTVKNAISGEILFESGAMNTDFSLKNESPTLTEPHYNTISKQDEVQIYEMVSGDVSGDFTTVLERAAVCLKDNRLPPLGFNKSDTRYDSTRIVGAADSDPDFNKINTTEGWGGDILHFHIPINGFTGKINVTARVLYQSIPPKWLNEIFSVDAPMINNWKSMYNTADRTPITVAEASLSGLEISPVSTKNLNQTAFSIYPNPSIDGKYFISSQYGETIETIKIYQLNGQLISTNKLGKSNNNLPLPNEKGIYMVVVETKNGVWSQKIVRN